MRQRPAGTQPVLLPESWGAAGFRDVLRIGAESGPEYDAGLVIGSFSAKLRELRV
jgi:hypothetical protein